MSDRNAPIYLDYAATTPLDAAVLAAMQPYFAADFYNPSATYTAARRVHAALETARAQVAQQLGARSSELLFTAGATEANNLAIHGIMRRYPAANLVVSAIEHESVLRPAQCYRAKAGGVRPDGIIDLAALKTAVDDMTVLISIMYANNEIGTIQPIRAVTRLAEAVRRERAQRGNTLPLYVHTDAAQAGNYLDLHVSRLGVDLMSLNGSKLYGPKQSGCLFVKAGVVLEPLIQGGGQERNLRSGTENVAGDIGFAAALDRAQYNRREETSRLQTLQRRLFDGLEQIPGVTVNGSRTHRLPNNVHVSIAGQDNERLLLALDEAGVMAAAGSACSASDEEPSHVLRAIGLSDQTAQSSLRFSMGRSTTAGQIDRLVALLARLVADSV